MQAAPGPEVLHYGLKRAGPRNFDKFLIKNYLQPKLGQFNFASRPIQSVYHLPLDEIIALEVYGENSEDGSCS